MSRTEHVIIHGRVQGVGYRAWAQHQAQLHGLSGWVRNRRDGAVEAVMAGPDDAIAAMLKALAQGPQGARVNGIEHLDDNGRVMVSDGFEILPTC
jgi:acylphosphatase